jgi:uncharacterized membrane protein YvbJ
MALIRCPECGNQVSTAAASCPKCGVPISSKGAGTPLSTIQQTSKRLKVHIVLSSVAFWIAAILLLASFASEAPSPFAIFLVLVCMVWYLVTKIRIWWHHK